MAIIKYVIKKSHSLHETPGSWKIIFHFKKLSSFPRDNWNKVLMRTSVITKKKNWKNIEAKTEKIHISGHQTITSSTLPRSVWTVSAQVRCRDPLHGDQLILDFCVRTITSSGSACNISGLQFTAERNYVKILTATFYTRKPVCYTISFTFSSFFFKWRHQMWC